jgi:hypothetical protein
MINSKEKEMEKIPIIEFELSGMSGICRECRECREKELLKNE